jgi:hypothetical protein
MASRTFNRSNISSAAGSRRSLPSQQGPRAAPSTASNGDIRMLLDELSEELEAQGIHGDLFLVGRTP